MKTRIGSALIAALCAIGCASEQAATRPDQSQTQQPATTTPAAEPKPAEPAPVAEAAPSGSSFTVPVDYYKLPNGLKVVLSEDHTAAKVAVGVYYNIGFRIEPKDRTGFAHLFEHMMFQGSGNLGKMEFIKLVQANGGVLNGSTRFDFTNYFEIVPQHALEPTLWAEADRMRGLQVNQENLVNQQGVVKNEVRVNVLNRPYGGFPWLDMPQYANTNWYNAHNFYGDLEDLDAANLEDVRSFFKQYYAPNNAVFVLVGDFDPANAKALIEKYFGNIPASERPQKPDLTEPRQEKEKRAERIDPLAPRPALAIAYHVPKRNTPEHYAMTLLHQILLEGKDSLLYTQLVQQKQLTGEVSGGINLLGNAFNYDGPMLWTAALNHDKDKSADQILAAIDEVIERVRTQPVDAATLERARIKARSALFREVEGFYGFGLADLMASFALFDDDPAKVNRLEQELNKVTPALLQKTAQEYLRRENRTVLELKTKS